MHLLWHLCLDATDNALNIGVSNLSVPVCCFKRRETSRTEPADHNNEIAMKETI